MLALNGTWNVLRAIAGHAARALTALEPEGLHRHARRNAADAAALVSAHRREADEVDRWAGARHARRVGSG